MHAWPLWTHGEVLKTVHNIEPRLASWEKQNHPAQLRLRAYLTDLIAKSMPLPEDQVALFLHLEIDVQKPERLLHHHDLENYLTPLFGTQWLDASRFVYATACKRVGQGSHLIIGLARQRESTTEGWTHFSCMAGSGASTPRWKANIREKLMSAQPKVLPQGPVDVQLAWR